MNELTVLILIFIMLGIWRIAAHVRGVAGWLGLMRSELIAIRDAVSRDPNVSARFRRFM